MPVVPPGWGIIGGITVSPAQRQFMQSALSKGLSASQAIKEMSGTDIAIRRTTGLALARELQGIERTRSQFKSTNRDKFVTPNQIAPSSKAMKEKYSYWGMIETRSKLTGEKRTVYANFSSSELLTKGMITDTFMAIMGNAQSAYNLETDGEWEAVAFSRAD